MADPLDQFRFDVDESLEAMAAREEQAARQRWQRIRHAIEHDNDPFAIMLRQFRKDAVDAVDEFAYADPTDARLMAMLQASLKRSLRTMLVIDAMRDTAEAIDANDAIESESETEPPTTPGN